MAYKTVRYANLTDKPIRYVKGLSGVPWPGCDAEPGGIIEVPEGPGYARHCAEAGFTLVTHEIEQTLADDANLKVMLAEDEAAKAKAKAEPDPEVPAEPAQVELPAVVADQTTKGKQRGRSNRSPEG